MIKRESIQELSLSARQRQLLELLIEGKSNKEISSDLKIEPGTVKQHLFVLFRKLGVSSRAKAVIVATQIMKGSELIPSVAKPKGRGKSSKAANVVTSISGENYSWRLVSSVAISIPQLGKLSPKFIAMRDHFLKSLRQIIDRLVDTLDGQVSYLPDGGLVIWFGHPRAHLDDADRAVYFAQYLQNWSRQYELEHQDFVLTKGVLKDGVGSLIGIGVASHTEVVAEKATELYGAESFRKASILAQHAKSLKMPISDQLTKKVAPMSSAWLDIKSKEGNKSVVVGEIGPISIVGPANISLPNASQRWGGFPFLDVAYDAIANGLAQWVSVESWPPAAATSLIDAIRSDVINKDFQIISLRTPGSYRRDRLLSSFTNQIELQFPEIISKSEKIYSTQGERIAGLLAEITKTAPVAVLVYGLKALDTFKGLIGEAGIDRLASKPILIVAANLQDAGNTQISVRLLGSKPKAAPFLRIYELKMPALDTLSEGIRVDLRAMLDNLNPLAKELIFQAANDLNKPILSLLSAMNESHHQAQACIQELTSSGLIAASQGGGFEFRDLATAQAISQLNVLTSDVGV